MHTEAMDVFRRNILGTALLFTSESQRRPVAAANLRGYFTAHPQEYYELPAIPAPIGDAQRQCNATRLPPDLASADDEFMAG